MGADADILTTKSLTGLTGRTMRVSEAGIKCGGS